MKNGNGRELRPFLVQQNEAGRACPSPCNAHSYGFLRNGKCALPMESSHTDSGDPFVEQSAKPTKTQRAKNNQNETKKAMHREFCVVPQLYSWAYPWYTPVSTT